MISKRKFKKFNEKVAAYVTTVTGNMWFFWAALGFIIFLRVTNPPTMDVLLLNVENDLQLLLLAANAVVGAKQLSMLVKLLKGLDRNMEELDKNMDEHLAKETDK